MKSNLLKAALLASGAALVLGITAPAQAAAPVASGFVDAWGSLGHASFSESEGYYEDGVETSSGHYRYGYDFNQIGADGKANLLWDSGFGIQLDASYFDTKVHNSYEGYDDATTDLAAHFYQRSDDMLWGGFASVGSFANNRWGTVGAEFQEYVDQWTFYGQVSWSKPFDGYFSDDHWDSWNFNVQARYFVTSHFELTAGLGFDTGSARYNYCCENDGEGGIYGYHEPVHFHAWNWTLRAEYLFEDVPVSIFGQYQGTSSPAHETDTSYTAADSDYDYNGYYVDKYKYHGSSNLFTLGVRLFLNQPDLMTNDRTGASLEDFNPWTGMTNSIPGYDGPGFGDALKY
jgi:hypothetical protein